MDQKSVPPVITNHSFPKVVLHSFTNFEKIHVVPSTFSKRMPCHQICQRAVGHWLEGENVSDWLACLGKYPVYVIPFARVSFVPRGKLEKPLLKQELLFIPNQYSKFSTSLTVLESQPLNQLCFSHHPLNKDYYVSISKSRAMSVMCHNPYHSHIRHCLLEIISHGKDSPGYWKGKKEKGNNIT